MPALRHYRSSTVCGLMCTPKRRWTINSHERLILIVDRPNKQYQKKRLPSILLSAAPRALTLSIKFALISPTALFPRILSAAPVFQENRTSQTIVDSRQISKVCAATALPAPQMPPTRAAWAPTSTSAAPVSPCPMSFPCLQSISQQRLLQRDPLRQERLLVTMVFPKAPLPA